MNAGELRLNLSLRGGALYADDGRLLLSAADVEVVHLLQVVDRHQKVEALARAFQVRTESPTPQASGLTTHTSSVPTFDESSIPCSTSRAGFYAARDQFDQAWHDYWADVLTYDLFDAAVQADNMEDALGSMNMWYEIGQINGCW